MPWNVDQYLRFAEPRLRPAIDLLARIPLSSPASVCDLGCGAGNVTRILNERWPEAHITGIDDSEDMLRRARSTLPAVRWIKASIGSWTPEKPVDVIFSNAALHWLPDHERLLPALASHLAGGGVLAVQMPRNFAAPSHRAIEETVRSGPWRNKLLPLLRASPVSEPAVYFEILRVSRLELDIWETEYLHVLTGHNPVKEWTKGTWLKRFLDVLAPDEAARFEEAYAERTNAAYPPLADGRTLFPFRRLFIVAQRERTS